MKASLVMLVLIVASWMYASKQGWDGTWKPSVGLLWNPAAHKERCMSLDIVTPKRRFRLLMNR
jgi:hypothetical protein